MTTQELYGKIGRWNELVTQLASVKDQEAKLRKEIFDACFPTPTEGTNIIDMPEGWKLKATHKLNRSVDESALPAALEALRKKKISVDDLIRYKPELSVSAYRKLAPEHAKILEQAMTIKPGTPVMELVAPKS